MAAVVWIMAVFPVFAQKLARGTSRVRCLGTGRGESAQCVLPGKRAPISVQKLENLHLWAPVLMPELENLHL